MTRLLARLDRYSYLGPIIRYQYVHAYKLKDRAPQLLAGQPMTVTDVGVGLSYTLDSRDFILNASRGWFLQLDLMSSPTFLGNNNTYYSARCSWPPIVRRGVVLSLPPNCIHGSVRARCRGQCCQT